jgi:hypothetical protein
MAGDAGTTYDCGAGVQTPGTTVPAGLGGFLPPIYTGIEGLGSAGLVGGLDTGTQV